MHGAVIPTCEVIKVPVVCVFMSESSSIIISTISKTVQPLYHAVYNELWGPVILSFIERLTSLQRLKCTSIIDLGPQTVSL